jgi:hypothetical protein
MGNVGIFYGHLEYLRPFGIFNCHLAMLWLFGMFPPIFVHCVKKNLATLRGCIQMFLHGTSLPRVQCMYHFSIRCKDLSCLTCVVTYSRCKVLMSNHGFPNSKMAKNYCQCT